MAKHRPQKPKPVLTGIDGARVRALREALKLSQFGLGRIVNMDTTRISRIENNRVDIAASYIPVLVAALRTNADYLLRITDDPGQRK
jgi:transcriptional regulator with XRE-family HTH domain